MNNTKLNEFINAIKMWQIRIGNDGVIIVTHKEWDIENLCASLSEARDFVLDNCGVIFSPGDEIPIESLFNLRN